MSEFRIDSKYLNRYWNLPATEDEKLKDYEFLDQIIADGLAVTKIEFWQSRGTEWETHTIQAKQRLKFRGSIYERDENLMFPLSKRLN